MGGALSIARTFPRLCRLRRCCLYIVCRGTQLAKAVRPAQPRTRPVPVARPSTIHSVIQPCCHPRKWVRTKRCGQATRGEEDPQMVQRCHKNEQQRIATRNRSPQQATRLTGLSPSLLDRSDNRLAGRLVNRLDRVRPLGAVEVGFNVATNLPPWPVAPCLSPGDHYYHQRASSDRGVLCLVVSSCVRVRRRASCRSSLSPFSLCLSRLARARRDVRLHARKQGWARAACTPVARVLHASRDDL